MLLEEAAHNVKSENQDTIKERLNIKVKESLGILLL